MITISHSGDILYWKKHIECPKFFSLRNVKLCLSIPHSIVRITYFCIVLNNSDDDLCFA